MKLYKVLMFLVAIVGCANAQKKLPVYFPKDLGNYPVSVLYGYDTVTHAMKPIGVDTMGHVLVQIIGDSTKAKSDTTNLWVQKAILVDIDSIKSQLSNPYYIHTDSLRYGDSIKTAYFNGQYLYGFVTLIDTSLGTSNHQTDSVYFETYDTLTGTWRNLSTGLLDMYTQVPNASGSLIIGGDNSNQGLTKTYMIYMPYPRTFRLRRVNVSNIATRTSYIIFTGKGK